MIYWGFLLIFVRMSPTFLSQWKVIEVPYLKGSLYEKKSNYLLLSGTVDTCLADIKFITFGDNLR